MVQLKKKITIKIKHGEESSSSKSIETRIDEERKEEGIVKKKSTNVWLGAISILILAVIVFLCIRSCNQNDEAKKESNDLVAHVDSIANEKKSGNSIVTANDQINPHTETVNEMEETSSSDVSGSETHVDSIPVESLNQFVEEEKWVKDAKMNVEDNLSIAEVEAKAKDVIRGIYGNGMERRTKLGSSYSEIQGKVNEMYRKGTIQ